MFLLLIGVALAVPPASDPALNITHANGSYTATAASFPSPLLSQLEAVVSMRATATCREKQVDWGKFSFTENRSDRPGAAVGTIEGYRRNFRCIPAKVVLFEPAPADWKASVADEADVRRFFHDYYAVRDAGAIEAALAKFGPDVVRERKEWANEVVAGNAARGRGTRRVSAVTWYVNPAQAAHPGVFAAIDFVGNYPSMHMYCGYVGLWRRGPADYWIIHEEQNQHARSTDPGGAAQIAQMRAAMCRGN